MLVLGSGGARSKARGGTRDICDIYVVVLCRFAPSVLAYALASPLPWLSQSILSLGLTSYIADGHIIISVKKNADTSSTAEGVVYGALVEEVVAEDVGGEGGCLVS